jgi:uncharacterized protein
MTGRMTLSEEEYFARQDAELRRAHALELERLAEQGERERARELHHMRCPKCGMPLETIDLRGVQVDRCGSCRGTWLDDGELELLARKDPGPMRSLASSARHLYRIVRGGA